MNLLLIGLKEESQWTSCRSIKKNLLSTYQSIDNYLIDFYEIKNAEYLANDLNEIAKLLSIKSFSKIIFIDHRPNPAKILSLLSKLLPLKKIPSIVIHLYGDFTYFSKDFKQLNEDYIDHEIQFFAASTSQQNLINFFLEEKNCNLYPFSVDDNFYQFNPIIRDEFRNLHRVGKNEKIVLYTGRLSLQKNIEVIIKDFENYKQSKKTNDKLFLAGHFDDFGARFMGGRCLEGYYFNKISKIINNSSFKTDIKLLGQLNPTELLAAYCGADLYVNYSLHHDEDFGISPLEAHACQLPLLLTPWGGFNDFPANYCKLKLDDFGYHISLGGIAKHISQPRSQLVYKKPDPNNLLTNKKITFKGFNKKLNEFIQYFSTEGVFLNRPNLQSTPSVGNFYSEVYSSYSKLSNEAQSYININWLFDHIENSQLESGFNFLSKERDIYEDLLPYSTSYYSPIPADFFQNGKPEIIKSDEILIRNGVDSIEEFLKSHNNFQQTFYFPDFFHLEKLNISYLYQITPLPMVNKKEQIILSACFLENFSKAKIKEELIQLQNIFTKNNFSTIYLLETENPLFKNAYTMIAKFLDDINLNYKKLSWISFRSIVDMRQTLFYEIIDPNLILNTFSAFSAQSRGAAINANRTVLDSKKWSMKQTYALSPFHQLITYQRVD